MRPCEFCRCVRVPSCKCREYLGMFVLGFGHFGSDRQKGAYVAFNLVVQRSDFGEQDRPAGCALQGGMELPVQFAETTGLVLGAKFGQMQAGLFQTLVTDLAGGEVGSPRFEHGADVDVFENFFA